MRLTNYAPLLGIFLVACTHGACPWKRHHAVKIGPWENIYRGDERLAGVVVQQYPETAGMEVDYQGSQGKHPAGVTFVFWDGRSRKLTYDPTGSVLDDYWLPEDMRYVPGSLAWKWVDFRFGSDPKFKSHRDPRKAR
jgi:hypothetical protein